MNNNAKINNNLLNNSTDTGRITILLVVLGFLLIVFVAIMGYINYKRYNQFKIQDFVEVELIETAHNCKNKLHTVPANKIPSSSLGNEYSLNMWYILMITTTNMENLNMF